MTREMPGLRIWETPIYKGLVKGKKRRGGFYDWGQRGEKKKQMGKRKGRTMESGKP